jgi:hypothetical protein
MPNFEQREQQNTCLNCAHVFTGAYCPACGQKHGPPMPTARELASDFLRSAMSPAGKIFESLRTLLMKPGELSRVYFAGQRLRFVHPIRLYLLGVFLFAAAAGLNGTWRDWNEQPRFEVTVGDVFGQKKTSPNDSTDAQTSSASKKAGEDIGRGMKEVLPEWMRDWIKRRAERSKDLTAEQLRDKAVRATSGHTSLIFALLVPFMAAVNRLLYFRSGVSYAGHVVFLLHSTAASCLILLPPFLLNLPLAYFPMMLVCVTWAVLAARRAFGVSLWSALWRYVVSMVPGMILSVIAGMVIATFVIVFA